MAPRGATIARCLESIDVDPTTHFAAVANVDDEWKLVKKAYYKKALATHPDKGGDAAEFRDVQSAFEVLRDFFDKGRVDTFRSTAFAAADTAAAYAEAAGAAGDYQSWDYYADAAAEEVPLYRVEPARSNRSTCQATGEAIPKGAVRVGVMDHESGSYFRRADIPLTGRGGAAAATWMFREDKSRQRRGRDVDVP